MTFHQHLDACPQCHDRPFDLCAEGARRLKEEVEVLLDKAGHARQERARAARRGSTPSIGDPSKRGTTGR